MSRTYRKLDSSYEGYIEEKKVRKLDKKHLEMLVSDGTTMGSLYDYGDNVMDQKGKKAVKKKMSKRVRSKNHKEEMKGLKNEGQD